MAANEERVPDLEKILRATPNVAKAVTATVPPRRTETPHTAIIRVVSRPSRANEGDVFRFALLIGGRLLCLFVVYV